MENFFEKFPFIDKILKGIGQIMLQENSWTGLLFIIGIFIGSWQCGIAIIVATIIGTLTAMLLKYDEKEINSGLYGFSPALVGVALIFLFRGTPIIWGIIILTSSLASILQHFFIIRKIPAFTFPFIAITWVTTYLLHQYTDIPPSEMLQAKFVDSEYSDVFTAICGFGEVIFQGSALSGLVFFIAVFINSPISALYGVIASLLGAFFSHLDEQPLTHIHMGLFGFNAVLSAIVFSGNRKIDGLWVLISVIITIIIDDLLIDYKVLNPVGGVFTFPFVAATWITLGIQKLINKKTA